MKLAVANQCFITTIFITISISPLIPDEGTSHLLWQVIVFQQSQITELTAMNYVYWVMYTYCTFHLRNILLQLHMNHSQQMKSIGISRLSPESTTVYVLTTHIAPAVDCVLWEDRCPQDIVLDQWHYSHKLQRPRHFLMASVKRHTTPKLVPVWPTFWQYFSCITGSDSLEGDNTTTVWFMWLQIFSRMNATEFELLNC